MIDQFGKVGILQVEAHAMPAGLGAVRQVCRFCDLVHRGRKSTRSPGWLGVFGAGLARVLSLGRRTGKHDGAQQNDPQTALRRTLQDGGHDARKGGVDAESVHLILIMTVVG